MPRKQLNDDDIYKLLEESPEYGVCLADNFLDCLSDSVPNDYIGYVEDANRFFDENHINMTMIECLPTTTCKDTFNWIMDLD